jgi:hypothetical protein
MESIPIHFDSPSKHMLKACDRVRGHGSEDGMSSSVGNFDAPFSAQIGVQNFEEKISGLEVCDGRVASVGKQFCPFHFQKLCFQISFKPLLPMVQMTIFVILSLATDVTGCKYYYQNLIRI